jgi:two-component system response regulator YesN
LKVLMVEDEVLTREGMKQCIPWESLGIQEVYTAEDGEEGLEKALEIRPDIIMADVRMPRMDGISMAFEIRKKLKNCRFIFISGYCDKEYLKSAIQLSAVNYIEKPIEPEEVVEALKKSILQLEEEKRRQAVWEDYQKRFQGVLEEVPEEDLIPASWQQSMHMADKIEHYIQDHFSDMNLSLTMMSDHFGLTKQYLCWLYKKEKNETINQYIIKTRLKWAKEYMRRNPFVKIKNVAARAGFADSSYFIKIYKKYEQITPADFLKECNEKEI